MSWFPTHFTLEGLIAWVMISDERKAEFKKNWYIFFLLNLTALVPDGDVLFRSHRGIFNSLLIPISILTVGFSIFLASKLLSDLEKRKKVDFIAFCTMLVAFFWGFHIILDVDSGGPNALFYPLDNKTYEINFLLEMTSQAAFPVKIVIDVIFQPLAAGLSTYILNWTPEQRIASFGETFFWALPELVMNLAIAICWLYFVGKEIFPLSSFSNLLKSRKSAIRTLKRISLNTFTAVGVIFILFGLFLGPVLEQHPIQSISVNRTLIYSPQTLTPSFSTNMETMDQLLQPRATHRLYLDFTTVLAESPGNVTWVGVVCRASEYNKNFTTKAFLLFAQHFDTAQLPENDSQFKTEYIIIVSDFLKRCIATSEPLKAQNTTLTVDITEPGDYVAAAVLSNWDSYQQLNETVVRRSVTIDMLIEYDRSVNYALGVTLGVIGVLIAVAPAIQEARIYRNRRKDRKSTDA
ncbi:MAG: hypothetical protein ACFFD4_03050 [Candidatus Odinarchaeota archaeon]